MGDFEPFVSILMPAYNEKDVIAEALTSLLNINYTNYEVLVIDDGSTDSTAAIAQHIIYQHPHKNARIITKKNGGKASALNHGITEANGDIILCVDADSRLNKNSIREGIKHFINPKVAAVSGFIRVASTHNLILKFQDLEYAITLNFTRPALALSGSVTIVPGPAGMFRKKALNEVSGYIDDKLIFAEDADLTIRLLSAGWEITSESELISYTEAPDNLRAMLRQRYRWNRGILQAMSANLIQLFKQKGWRGKLISLYLVLDAYGIRIINFSLLLYFLGNFYTTGDVRLFSQWFFLLVAIDGIIILFTAKSIAEYAQQFVTMIISRFSYSFILLSWGVLSLIDECINSSMSWDKLERTGQISEVSQ